MRDGFHHACKPGSVSALADFCHLSERPTRLTFRLPGVERAILPFPLREMKPDLFGLAAHEVFPPATSLPRAVSSYLTFSPFPPVTPISRDYKRWLFSAALSVSADLATKPPLSQGVELFAARTFLSAYLQNDRTA